MSRDSERRLDRAVEELVAALAEHVAATVDERTGEDRERPFTSAEVEKSLAIGKTKRYALMHSGELVGYKQGSRRLYSAAEVRRYRARVAGEIEVVRVSD